MIIDITEEKSSVFFWSPSSNSTYGDILLDLNSFIHYNKLTGMERVVVTIGGNEH